MKARIQAGAEIDFLTRGELDGVLEEHFQRFRGVRFKRLPFSGPLPVRTPEPESGFVWSVKLLSIVYDLIDSPRVYSGSLENSSLVGVERRPAREHVLKWTDNQLVLFGTQPLIVSSFGKSAQRASGLLLVEEVRVGDEWQL